MLLCVPKKFYIYRCYYVYQRNFIYIYRCYCVYHRNSIKNTSDFLKYIYVTKQSNSYKRRQPQNILLT